MRGPTVAMRHLHVALGFFAIAASIGDRRLSMMMCSRCMVKGGIGVMRRCTNRRAEEFFYEREKKWVAMNLCLYRDDNYKNVIPTNA